MHGKLYVEQSTKSKSSARQDALQGSPVQSLRGIEEIGNNHSEDLNNDGKMKLSSDQSQYREEK